MSTTTEEVEALQSALKVQVHEYQERLVDAKKRCEVSWDSLLREVIYCVFYDSIRFSLHTGLIIVNLLVASAEERAGFKNRRDGCGLCAGQGGTQPVPCGEFSVFYLEESIDRN